MKLIKALTLAFLATQLSFADLDYCSTLGTNDRNSGPKVAVALALSTGIFVLAYWWFIGREMSDLDKTGEIRYTDRVEKVTK